MKWTADRCINYNRWLHGLCSVCMCVRARLCGGIWKNGWRNEPDRWEVAEPSKSLTHKLFAVSLSVVLSVFSHICWTNLVFWERTCYCFLCWLLARESIGLFKPKVSNCQWCLLLLVWCEIYLLVYGIYVTCFKLQGTRRFPEKSKIIIMGCPGSSPGGACTQYTKGWVFTAVGKVQFQFVALCCIPSLSYQIKA